MPRDQENAGVPEQRVPGRRTAGPTALVTLAGVIAILVASIALLVLSVANWREVDRIDRTLTDRLDKLDAQVAQVASRVDRAQAPAAPRGPDPKRVYVVSTTDAPVRGPVGALVTIAEFSDFQ